MLVCVYVHDNVYLTYQILFTELQILRTTPFPPIVFVKKTPSSSWATLVQFTIKGTLTCPTTLQALALEGRVYKSKKV